MNFAREQHAPPVAAQVQQGSLASRDPSMRASFNHGAPQVAATSRAGAFSGQGVVAAHGAPGQPAAAAVSAQRAGAPAPAMHNEMALRSSSFGPHAAAAASHPAGGGGYSPATNHATYTPHTASSHSYQPAYRPEAAHAAPMRPAPANHAPAAHPHGAPSHGGQPHEEHR
jgi:hypothetical protein